jgi:hypothetical protein
MNAQKLIVSYFQRLGVTAVVIAMFAFIGVTALMLTNAATTSHLAEAEQGVKSGCVSTVQDSSAGGGGAIRFGNDASCGQFPAANAGAHLPISYDLKTLQGTVLYVATNGSDAANGSANAPFATLSKAISATSNGGTIVVKGGTYRQGNLTVPANKTVRIIAYPGEKPVFAGSVGYTSGWTSEGGLKWHSYAPQPATDGSGISFTTGMNLTGDGIGKYPDQAWVGNTQLRQVSAKTAVTGSTFWVDRSASRIYVTAANADTGNFEASQRDVFLTVQAPNTTLEGVVITRFSNSANDYGVVKFLETADNSVMRNVEVSDSAFISVFYSGNSNLHKGSLMRNVTVSASNWMGISATYTDSLVMDSVKVVRMNQFNEFTHSPQSGGLKTSRTRYTKVINSDISNNNSHGLWFDQSNLDVDVANNMIVDNAGAGLFFEISDDLLAVNNYIRSPNGSNAVKLAGSSGNKLINNTIIGGPDALGIYVDNRSRAGCADPAQPLCANSYNSDRDTVRTRPASLDWLPRLDIMLNNIIASPSRNGFCGRLTAVCITQSNGGASVPIQTVIHKADSLRPQTVINGNVYANGTGTIIATAVGNYTTTSAFASAMAGSPVGISGFEANGRSGAQWVTSEGTPTTALKDAHAQATPVPTNANINQYIQAGTRHYGVTYK